LTLGAPDRQRFLSLIAVSRETEERLAIYVDLLARWQAATNLVSERTLDHVWTRHLADSAQLLDLNPAAACWLDIGSGAGFPGIVIAIRLAEKNDGIVHCVESDRRKCAFLREVVRATGARARIHSERIECVDRHEIGSIEAVTARAFAPLSSTFLLSQDWLAQGARGLFPRGKSANAELRSLGPIPGYRAELIPSVLDSESAIVVIRTENSGH
jgi:16S rRNA (guanine527-N7)-methyltransferase